MNRNKKLNDRIDYLGDVHLGRRFRTGVPLERKGQREESLMVDLEDSLMSTQAKIHVQVGDLFDAFIVPIEVVIRAAEIYKKAAEKNQDVLYVVYRGNHDASRNIDRKSSFDLFQMLLQDVQNIRVLSEVSTLDYYGLDIGIIPWHPFKSAAELADELPNDQYDYVFGHWDCSSFGNDFNLIPIDNLRVKTNNIVTGHEHNARTFTNGDMNVIVTGSMQPYSHAEDADHEMYVTLTLDQFRASTLDFSDKNVRFLLKEGEDVPEIDAMSVTYKRVNEQYEEADLDVGFESFDMMDLFKVSLKEAGVNEKFSEKVTEKFTELKVA